MDTSCTHIPRMFLSLLKHCFHNLLVPNQNYVSLCSYIVQSNEVNANMRWLGLAVVFLCHATTSVLASMGDSLYSYRICLVNCQRSCDDVGYPSDLPWSLKVFGWTCEDECKYSCMHKVTAKDVEHERPIKQFHGKVHIYVQY